MSQAANLEWVNRVRALRNNARALVMDFESLSLHAQANDIAAEIAASVEAQSPVFDGSDMPLQVAVDLITVFGDLQAWLDDAAAPGRPSRMHVLFVQG